MKAAIGGLVLAVASCSAMAGAVSVNGTIGSEWTGVTPVHVTHQDGTPEGNFGAPTQFTDSTAYDIYMRADASYVYVGLETVGGPAAVMPTFANLYFGTQAQGSILGFEVINNRAFVPGVSGYYNYTATSGIESAFSNTASASTIEFAVPWALLQNDTLGTGKTFTNTVQLRLSQTFGYSVAGGATYGNDRLGLVTAVPLPAASTAGVGLFGALAFWKARRRKAK